jgi:ABC-type multidrug transport system fused ATPase/permease subunit
MVPTLIGILYYFEDLKAEKVGLFFMCIFVLGYELEDLFYHMANFEVYLVPVERCHFFSNLVPEVGYKNILRERKLIGKGGTKNLKKLDSQERRKDAQIEAIKKGEQAKSQECVEEIVKSGDIQVQGVFARYYGCNKDVLENLSFSVKSGQKIGVIGRSGSGKSSLLKLFWRYFDPREGRILIDGKDISRTDIKDLRSQITVISQETHLFEGTLRENLDPMGWKYDDKRLNEIMHELSFRHQSFSEKGLEMQIDSEGTNLSQGEKQLICFARAVLSPSKLILLDEATANIDLETEVIIQKTMNKYFKDSTAIIVAHRIQTVLECDKILVIDAGKQTDFDSPENLKQKEGYFQEIYRMSQL